MNTSKSILILFLISFSTSSYAWIDWIVKSGPPPLYSDSFTWIPAWNKSTFCPSSTIHRTSSSANFFNGSNGSCHYTHRTKRKFSNGDDDSDWEYTLYCDPLALSEGKTCTGITQPDPEPAYACTDNNSSNPPSQLNINTLVDIPLYQNTGKYAHKGCLYTPTFTTNDDETYTKPCFDFTLARIDNSQPDISDGFQNDLSTFQCEVEPEPEPEPPPPTPNPPPEFDERNECGMREYRHHGAQTTSRPVVCKSLVTDTFVFEPNSDTEHETIFEHTVTQCRQDRFDYSPSQDYLCKIGQKFYKATEKDAYVRSLITNNNPCLLNDPNTSEIFIDYGIRRARSISTMRCDKYKQSAYTYNQELAMVRYTTETITNPDYDGETPDPDPDPEPEPPENDTDYTALINAVKDAELSVDENKQSVKDVETAIQNIDTDSIVKAIEQQNFDTSDIVQAIQQQDFDTTDIETGLTDINNSLNDSSTTFSTSPSSGLTGYYSPVYPNGFDDVWNNNRAAFDNSATKQYINSWKIQVAGTYVYPTFCLDMGIANFGCHQITIDPRVFPFIRILLIITALIVARQITLGA